MNWPLVFLAVALVLAVIELVRARGQSLLVWAVTLICVALLWEYLPL